MEKYCYGCGAELQKSDPEKIGYLPPEIEKNDPLCQRCYQLTHYGKKPAKALVNIDQDKIFEDIKDSFVVFVVDLLNFTYSMIKELTTQLQGRKVLLVANKVDLLPESINKEKLRAWVLENAKEHGLDILDLFLCSASTNYSIKEMLNRIMELREGKNVYLVGAANVGKSSIVNALLKNYSNNTSHFISVSRYPGTTLSKIEIPIDENTYLYDTPGFINPRAMTSWLEPALLREIMPDKRLKPKTFQIDSPQTFHFGSLARVDYHSHHKVSFITYFASPVEIHRAKLITDKDRLIGKIKPASSNIKKKEDLVEIFFSIFVDGKIDFIITGYGHFTISGKGSLDLVVMVPPGVDVVTTESMI